MRYAVASRKNTDSLVKAMILFDQGGGRGGEGRGEKVMDNIAPPHQSVVGRFILEEDFVS